MKKLSNFIKFPKNKKVFYNIFSNYFFSSPPPRCAFFCIHGYIFRTHGNNCHFFAQLFYYDNRNNICK